MGSCHRRSYKRELFQNNRRQSHTIAEPTVANISISGSVEITRFVLAGKSQQTTWRTSGRKFCCDQIYFFCQSLSDVVLSSAIVCDRLDLGRRIADDRRTFCDLRFAIRISKTALTNFSLLLLKRHSGKQLKYHIAGGLLSVVLANCLYPR